MFVVMEFQTTLEGVTAIVPPFVYATLNEAKSKYHSILSAAAISSVAYHAAAILSYNGTLIESECFEHLPEPEEPEEPEEAEE